MIKKLLVVFSFLFLVLIYPSPALADNEFSTSYDTTYDFDSNGVAQVTQKITLKNLTSQYYVSSFTLTIGSTNVTDVQATDTEGPMESKVEQSSNKTSIAVKFNKPVAGVGKAQVFTLRLKSKDFAQNLGKTWEVNLPKIPQVGNIESYNLVLSVPLSFGEPTSISPKVKTESQTYDRLFFIFSKDSLQKNGVSVNFGTTQVFDFNLNYELQNKSLVPVLTSVAIPPDTSYQQVLISRISPEPVNVTIDEDGNYLAWYKLSRNNQQKITITGSAKLFITPPKSSPDQAEVIPILDSASVKNLTKSDHYWEVDNPVMKATLEEIFKGGEPKSSKEKARLIYQFVITTLSYDDKRVTKADIERLGAVTVLNNPQSAICMEFTDLFIALTRAAGIPAREMDGFAYTSNSKLRPLSLNKDLLHAWPEYFDEAKGWVMVDPTWENTSGGVDYFNKFDLNHLALAIRGFSSEVPTTSDDVKVTVTSIDFTAKPQIDVEIESPNLIWSGFPSSVKIKVLNKGQSLISEGKIDIKTNRIKNLGPNNFSVGPIPPYGSLSYYVNLRTPSLLENFDDQIVVSISGKEFSKKIEVKPIFFFRPFPYLFIALSGGIIVVYLLILGIHFYQRRLKNGSK